MVFSCKVSRWVGGQVAEKFLTGLYLRCIEVQEVDTLQENWLGCWLATSQCDLDFIFDIFYLSNLVCAVS